jgi:hypothetical protein
MSKKQPTKLSRRSVIAAGVLGAAAAAVDLSPFKGSVAQAAGATETTAPSVLGTGSAAGTTLSKRVVPSDPILHNQYGGLEYAFGEKHLVRRITPSAAAPVVNRPLIAFAHMSDLHIVDDKSPGRLEFLDDYVKDGYDFGSAYRPHEFFSSHMTDAMCRAIAKIQAGPATGLPLCMTLVTGDSVDNVQYNETRWYMDLLDGNTITPRSGSDDEESVSSFKLTRGFDPPRKYHWHPRVIALSGCC